MAVKYRMKGSKYKIKYIDSAEVIRKITINPRDTLELLNSVVGRNIRRVVDLTISK